MVAGGVSMVAGGVEVCDMGWAMVGGSRVESGAGEEVERGFPQWRRVESSGEQAQCDGGEEDVDQEMQR